MNMEEQPAEAVDRTPPAFQQFREKGAGLAEPFFSTPELRQRLDLLRHLTDNSEKILLVKGCKGAGKSTLLDQFKKLSREEWDLCCIDANHTFHPDQFFSHLYRRYGLTDEADHSIEHLIKRFELLAAAGRKAVIVIDDAQHLPVATMIAIFRLFERRPGNRALIRIVLFATPEIANQLQTPQLQAMNLQSIQALDMPLLDSQQAQSFVQFLLDVWNVTGHLKISGGSLNRLQRESKGVPGLLENQLRLLFSQVPAGQQSAQNTPSKKEIAAAKGLFSDLPKPVLAGIGLLGIVLLLTLLFQDGINSLFADKDHSIVDEPAPKIGEAATTRSLQLPPPAEETPSQPAAPLISERRDTLSDTPEEVSQSVELPAVSGPEPLSTQSSVDELNGLLNVENPLETTEVLDPVDATEVEVAAEADSPQSADVKAPIQAELSANEVPVVDQALVDEEPQEMPPKVVRNESRVPSQTGDVSRPPAMKADSGRAVSGIRREKWLLDQLPTAYTLQLVGVKDEQAAKRFIEQYRLLEDAAYFKTMRSGEAWYSVLYGHFPDRATAIKARGQLPAALRKRDVWPRTFASVQAAIEKK